MERDLLGIASAQSSNDTFQSVNITFTNSSSPIGSVSPIFRPTEQLVWIILTSTISFIGAFNNILVLLVTWPENGRKSGLNLLIFHFVAANLVMCLIHIPITVFTVLAKRLSYSIASNACSYIHALYHTGTGIITWSDAGLAVNRCIALFYPHSYKSWTTKMVNFGIIALTWMIVLSFYLPPTFGVAGKVSMNPLGLCGFQPSHGSLGRFFTVFVYFPYAIAGMGAILILGKTYYVTSRRRSVGPIGENSRLILHRLRMAKILLFTFLWSAICMVPWGVIVVDFPWLLQRNPMVSLWLRTCYASQYAFTPCVLLMSNKEYRIRLLRILHHGFIASRTRDMSAVTNKHFSRQPTD